MPPFSASTVISARHWVTTPSMRLWQIFASRARSPSPTYVAWRADVLEQRRDPVVGLLRPGHDDAQQARPHHLAVAADRGGEEVDATLGADGPHRDGRLGRDGRAVDDDGGHVVGVGQQAALADQHLLEVGGGRDHREDDVAGAQVGDRVGDRAADLGERLGLGAGAVPDGDVHAGAGEPAGHGGAHPAGADPADRSRVRRCGGVVHGAPSRVARVSAASCDRGRSGEPCGEPVGGVRAVPGRDVGAAVVAVLEHQQLDGAGDGVAQPLGVLPGDQPVAGVPNTMSSGRRDRRRPPRPGRGSSAIRARLVVGGRARAHPEGVAGQLRQARPSSRRSCTGRPGRRRRATRSPSAAATRGA